MRSLTLLLLIVVLFNSCGFLNSSEMFRSEKDSELTDFDSTAAEYVIKPYDKIDLRVYTNKGERLIDVTGNSLQDRTPLVYLVEHDGQVKLPTLGRIEIAGNTIRQAEDILETKYKEHFQDPFVFIKITNRRVIVYSDGSTKGEVIEITEENYTLIEALAESGGISDYSKAHRVKLIRGNLSSPKVYIFNISNIKDMNKANFVLQANDIIYVEARPRYASRLLVEITPYLNLVTTGILVYSLFNNK